VNPFNQKVLNIDCRAEAERISEFLKRAIFKDYRRKGAVVGISGGIDSALSATLSVKAFGKERVLGLILPEKESSPMSVLFAEQLAHWLGIRVEVIEITPILEALGVYQKREGIVKKYFPQFSNGCKFKLVISKDSLHREGLNVFYLVVIDEKGETRRVRLSLQDYLEMVAATDMKQRTRMIHLYYQAEKNNYAVVGTTNKSELLQGFFVKYGDGWVDIEPIAHLYKTQVYQLSQSLGIPQPIIDRVPSPDTWSAEVSDEEFYFKLPYPQLDLLLYAYEKKVPLDEVSKVVGMEQEAILRVYKDFDSKKRATWHLRVMPLNLIDQGD